jgi:hypothetical protein
MFLHSIQKDVFKAFIKSKKQENSGVAPLRGNDGMLHSASNNKAEILNAQFKSAYTQEDLKIACMEYVSP